VVEGTGAVVAEGMGVTVEGAEGAVAETWVADGSGISLTAGLVSEAGTAASDWWVAVAGGGLVGTAVAGLVTQPEPPPVRTHPIGKPYRSE